MNKFYFWWLIIICLVMAACGNNTNDSGANNPPTVPPLAPTLTITHGSLTARDGLPSVFHSSKTLAVGAQADIWADPPSAGLIFDRWIGADAWLDETVVNHAFLSSMPNNDVVVTATYRSAPQNAPTVVSSETLPFITTGGRVFAHYIIPTPMRALLVWFHGTGGESEALFSDEEQSVLSRTALANGFGVLALDSANRTTKQWDGTVSAANDDLFNLRLLLNRLTLAGQITDQTLIVTAGHSNGGAMSVRCAYLLTTTAPLRSVPASAVVCASAATQIIQTTAVPNWWGLMQNDEIIGTSGNLEAANNQLLLESRGLGSDLRMQLPAPLYPERFWRINGWTMEDSRILFTNIAAAGWLDANAYVIASPDTIRAQLSSLMPSNRAGAVNLRAAGDQIAATAAQHKFASEQVPYLLRFLSAYIPINN